MKNLMQFTGKTIAGFSLGSMIGFFLRGTSWQEVLLCAILLILSLILVSINEK